MKLKLLNLIKPVLTLCLTTIMVLGGWLVLNKDNQVHAASVSHNKIAGTDVVLSVGLGLGYNYPADPVGMSHYVINGQDAFCVEPHDFKFAGNYITSDTPNGYDKKYLSKIVYYGWDTSSKSEKDYFVTQLILWDEVMNTLHIGANVNGQSTTYTHGSWTASYHGTDYSKGSSAYQQAKAEVMAKVNGKVNLDKTTLELRVGQSETVTDTNGVLARLVLRENSANVDVQHNGNQLVITGRSDSVDGTISFKPTTQSYDDNGLSTIFYSGQGGQDLATFKLQDPDRTRISITMKKTGKIRLLKVDAETNQPLANVVFKFSPNPQLLGASTHTTDENGVTELTLEPGEYYYREEVALDGYVRVGEIKKVVVELDKTIEIKEANHKAKGQIVIEKHDSLTNDKLPNATFVIKNDKGQEVDKITTNQQGSAISKPLSLGIYTVQELEAPQGYLKTPEVFKVELKYQGQEVALVSKTLTVINDPVPTLETQVEFKLLAPEVFTTGKIEFVDYNNMCNLIENQEYTVVGHLIYNGEPLRDKDGNLIESKATFVATSSCMKVPNKFVVDTDIFQQGKTVVFEDLYKDGIKVSYHHDPNDNQQTVYMTKVIVKKVDSNDHSKVLKEAEFTIYQNGVAITTLKTDENGLASILLPQGDYEVKETKAPQGYKVSEQVIKFTVGENTENHEYTIVAPNELLPDDKLVYTGAESALLTNLMSLATFITGSGFVFNGVRKREE